MTMHLRQSQKTYPPLLAIFACFLILSASFCHGQSATESQQQINAIYEKIKISRSAQAAINNQREKEFSEQKSQQQARVDQLKAELVKKQAAFAKLKEDINSSDLIIDTLQQQLSARTHTLKDLFAAWRQVTTDSLSNQQNSLITSESDTSVAMLSQLARQKKQPDSDDLKTLGEILQRDITDTGRITRYTATVALADGSSVEQQIERVGPFTATSHGQFLKYDSARQSLSVAARQPPNEYIQPIQAASYQGMSDKSYIEAVIDPSRGIVLDQLALSPSLQERLQQGGLIGYAIIALGIAGLLLAFSRWIVITQTKLRINRQRLNPEQIDLGNPLGRILQAYQKSESPHPAPQSNTIGSQQPPIQNQHNTETLEVRLQEIVMQEMPKLDKGLGALKLLAAIAPLLGLLGTVVGMINTFQTITLVGAADPKLMAGGISQALMTTVLGLIVAVPLLFSHSFVAAKSRLLMIFLSQQSLGFIVKSLESKDTPSQIRG